MNEPDSDSVVIPRRMTDRILKGIRLDAWRKRFAKWFLGAVRGTRQRRKRNRAGRTVGCTRPVWAKKRDARRLRAHKARQSGRHTRSLPR